MAQFSNHLKILLTKPTTRIEEAKLVERPRHVRRSVRKREVGVDRSRAGLPTPFYNCKKLSESPTCAIIFHYFSVAPYLTNTVLLGGISGGRSWNKV